MARDSRYATYDPDPALASVNSLGKLSQVPFNRVVWTVDPLFAFCLSDSPLNSDKLICRLAHELNVS